LTDVRATCCLDDLEAAVAKHAPQPLFGSIGGAAETNLSLSSNRQVLAENWFVSRAVVRQGLRCQGRKALNAAA
jgi:hypothetical protein